MMEPKQKSTTAILKKEDKITALEALDEFQLSSIKRFSAGKIFSKAEPKSKKDWEKCFKEKRII